MDQNGMIPSIVFGIAMIKYTFLLCLIWSLRAYGLERSYSLKGLMEFAFEHSPKFKNVVNDLGVSKLKLSNSFSNFLPSLDLETNQGYQKSDPVEKNKDWTSELKLSLTSKLYDNGTNFINYRKNRSLVKIARLKVEYERSLLCLSIAQEYYKYSLTSKILQVHKFLYSHLRKQFHSIELQYKQGRKMRIDYIRFKARLQRAHLDMQNAQATQLKSIEEVRKLVGWPNDEALSLKLEEIESHHSNIPKISPNIKDHFLYKISELSRSVNDNDVTLKKREYWPGIFLEGYANYTNSNYLSGFDSFHDDRQVDLGAFVSIKFNLWDWGIRRRNISMAKLERKTKNNRLDEELLDLSTTLRKLMLDIELQKKNFMLGKELVELEKANYQALEKDS